MDSQDRNSTSRANTPLPLPLPLPLPVEMGRAEQHDQATSRPITPLQEPHVSDGVDNPLQSTSSFEPLQMPEPALVRQDTEYIGPSTDLPTPMPQTSHSLSQQPHGPAININLLLTSTGTRHPYRIDQKYLSKRNVSAEGEGGAFDPFVISVYTLKELIWRDWRDEWEPRPSSPSAIRLIHFGRFLDDKFPLKDCRFSDSAPNVVHMSVKPQEVLDDEENAKASGKSSSHHNRDREEPTTGCRCVIL